MIVFRNPGVLDIRSIMTFGVSAKDTDNPIGMFGTGLKYAIAVLLRNGQSITISTEDEYGPFTLAFGTMEEKLRSETFRTVTVTTSRPGQDFEPEPTRTPFTTELGKKWELWQAYRELWSNCTDESGEVFATVRGERMRNPEGPHVVIAVEGGQFEEVHKKRHGEVLAPERSVVYDDERICRVLEGPSSRIYYRGIRVGELRNEALYTYDIHAPLDLTEDRTLRYPYEAAVAVGSAIAHCDDKKLLRRVLLAESGSYEASVNFTYCPGASDGPLFRETVREVLREHPSSVNRTALQAAKVSMFESLPTDTESALPVNEVEKERLRRAVAFCERLGYDVRAYPILVVPRIDNGVLGAAHNGRIYLSQEVFEQGTKRVAGTLIEEFLHLSKHVEDETREMQNLLIDHLVGLGELLTGEPL